MDTTTRPTLRGPDARSISGRFWFVIGALALCVFALIIVVSFISATNDIARIERLKDHGVSVVVTVTSCVGNIGGSGSNAAGYTCRGSYRVHGVRYQEVIGSKTTLSSAGTQLRGIADPARPSTIELASSVAKSSSSLSAYVVPSLLTLLFVVLGFALFRRRHSRRAAPSSTSRSPVPKTWILAASRSDSAEIEWSTSAIDSSSDSRKVIRRYGASHQDVVVYPPLEHFG